MGAISKSTQLDNVTVRESAEWTFFGVWPAWASKRVGRATLTHEKGVGQRSFLLRICIAGDGQLADVMCIQGRI